MYEKINKELSQSLQHILRLNKINAILETLKKELLLLEEKSQSAKDTLKKESKDYEKISHKNISSIFYSVFGNLDIKTEKERQEALEAELKYNQYIRDLEEVKYQISKLETEKLQYKDAINEYFKCFNKKTRLLISKNDKTAHKIMELNENIDVSKNSICEINEALGVGDEVEKYLSDVLESLNSAKNWGEWDVWGGGLISDTIKHSHLDDASYNAQHVQSALRRFRTELADVHITKEFQIKIDGFTKFADFFFDGLIADWSMQKKINATLENVNSVKTQVQNVMSKLNELKKAELNTQNSLNTQLSSLVVDA